MQRSITLAIAAFFFLVIGAGVGAYFYKQNKPDKLWIPIPVKNEISEESKAEIERIARDHFAKPEVIERVSQDSGLPSNFITSRIFFEYGDFQDPSTMIQGTSFNIGLAGKRKERASLEKGATCLGKELRKVYQMPEPKGSPF